MRKAVRGRFKRKVPRGKKAMIAGGKEIGCEVEGFTWTGRGRPRDRRRGDDLVSEEH